jgi:hypothetical protein
MGFIKVGKDLGIFGSTAILNDMTLLGVGSQGIVGHGGGNTTLGRIGTGYMYADWQGQIAYTTPNMNGLQLLLGIMQPWNAIHQLNNVAGADVSATSSGSTDQFGYQGQGSYSWTGDFAGKVWVGSFTRSNRFTGAGGQLMRLQSF